MEVVKEGLSQEQAKVNQTPEQFNEQLNLEFALIRVRTAALELMKLKLGMLLDMGEKGLKSDDLSEAIKTVTANILKFPA